MTFIRVRWRELILGTLVFSNLFVWFAVYQRQPSDTLSVYFLDVGQGDAILIESPSKGRVLIDGGKNLKILSEIGDILPFGDKRIDVIVSTHPDLDHIGGLPEVISRYDTGLHIWSGVRTEKAIDDELWRRLGAKGVKSLIAKKGMAVNFGDGVKLAILFPDQDVSNWDLNDASIVARLDYGESSFLFTGDATIKTENTMMYHSGQFLDADVLKVGHHGSRTSTSLSFAEAVSPEYAIISAGKNNTYGHPHQNVLDILENLGVKILNTADLGTIKFVTDGQILETK